FATVSAVRAKPAFSSILPGSARTSPGIMQPPCRSLARRHSNSVPARWHAITQETAQAGRATQNGPASDQQTIMPGNVPHAAHMEAVCPTFTTQHCTKNHHSQPERMLPMQIHNIYVDDAGETHWRDIEVE